MRRLLVFGTGAAVIGIILLVVAFYVAYELVDRLQTAVTSASPSDTNALLEGTILDAVFMGVMATLGYVLVAKGLDGIRKQEFLETATSPAATLARRMQKSKLPLATTHRGPPARLVTSAAGSRPSAQQYSRPKPITESTGVGTTSAEAPVITSSEAKLAFPGASTTEAKPARSGDIEASLGEVSVQSSEERNRSAESTEDNPAPSLQTSVDRASANGSTGAAAIAEPSGFQGGVSPARAGILLNERAPPPFVDAELSTLDNSPTTGDSPRESFPSPAVTSQQGATTEPTAGSIDPLFPPRKRGRSKASTRKKTSELGNDSSAND